MSQAPSERLVLPILIPAPKVPGPLVKPFDERQHRWYDHRVSGVQVHCGGCCHRTFDVYSERVERMVDFPSMVWVKAGFAVAERMCPRCHVLVSCKVPLNPGEPVEDGVDGAWICPGCGVSLARIDRNTGKIKASCWRKGCRQTVTVTALAALTGRYGFVDEERANRLAARMSFT